MNQVIIDEEIICYIAEEADLGFNLSYVDIVVDEEAPYRAMSDDYLEDRIRSWSDVE